MNEREQAARVIAFFERSDDMTLLRAALEEAAPRVKRLVAGYLQRGTEESIPAPSDVRGAKDPAPVDEARRALREARDFSLLQAITRAIGQRIETLEIAASADFSPGARVRVPEKRAYPRAGAELAGEVEETGTVLKVRLDNGDTWQGPASLARLEAAR